MPQHELIRAASSPLQAVLEALPRIASSQANVLVTGESGAGKEGVARALHKLSPRNKAPLVPVNCGAIPEALLESELFGHVRGAFTGANRRRIGRFEAVRGGTLFLDEIGELPLAMQVKLLRVLQERVFEPVGAMESVRADFRLVAATNRELKDEVAQGRFRQDLFFRLDVVRVQVPPLRERPMDIPLLVDHFVDRYRNECGSRVSGASPPALRAMQAYDWPGNVRELQNFVQGVLVLKPEGKIELGDVESRLGGLPQPTMSREVADVFDFRDAMFGAPDPEPLFVHPPVAMSPALPQVTVAGLDLRQTVETVERALIRQALDLCDGNRSQAARLLRLNRTTLVEKIKRMPDLGL